MFHALVPVLEALATALVWRVISYVVRHGRSEEWIAQKRRMMQQVVIVGVAAGGAGLMALGTAILVTPDHLETRYDPITYGVVFVVFGAVFVGIAMLGRARRSRSAA